MALKEDKFTYSERKSAGILEKFELQWDNK